MSPYRPFFNTLLLSFAWCFIWAFATPLLADDITADDITIQKATIKANTIIYKEGISTAQGSVSFQGYGYSIKAHKVIYDHQSTQLEFFGSVQVQQDGSSENNYLVSDYIKAHISDDYLFIKPFLLRNTRYNNSGESNSTQKLWIQSTCADKQGYEYNLTDGAFSSCEDNQDPFWRIGFSQAQYNAKAENIYLENALFYIKDMPIAYLPFFSLYTGSEQKSGLLTPKISFSKSQVSVAQPIFFVPKPHIDIQITPQMRTQEGIGVYGTTRFIDSNHSQGSLTAGYFDRQDSNSTAYGIEFDYYNKFIDDTDEQNLFLSGIQYFNTPAYFSYKEIDTSVLEIDSISKSTLSYIHSYKDWFIGMHLKEFEQSKNGNKVQLLPLLQLHKTNSYLLTDIIDNDTVANNQLLQWLNRLTYNIDYSVQYENRKTGAIDTLSQQFTLPMVYHLSLFGDYFSLSIEETLKFTHKAYYRDSQKIDNNTYRQHLNTITLSSHLIKPYDNLLHNISIGANIKQLISGQSPSSNYKDSISITLDQYFFTGIDNALTHNLEQNIYKEEGGGFSQLDDMTNYLKWESAIFNIYNKSTYSFKEGGLSYLSNSLEYDNDDTQWYLSQLIDSKKQKDDEPSQYVNYITMGLAQVIFDDVKFSFDIEMDYEQKEVKKWLGVVEYIQDCWGYAVKFGRNTIPRFDGSKWQRADENHLIYFQMNFNPIGGFSQNYYF